MPDTRVKPSRTGPGGQDGRPAGQGPRLIGLDSSPLHGELLGVERLEERARALAAGFTLSRQRRGPNRLLRRLAENARVLRHAYRTLAGDVRRGEAIAPAAEWLLDNFHLVEGEFREIRHYLPMPYYQELPKLATRGRAGMARVYAMAEELLGYSDARLDPQRLFRFMNAYQNVTPLTIGELWAWPIMLKAALLEHLRRLSDELLASRAGRLEADRLFGSFETARTNGRPPTLPKVLHVAFVDELLQRMREYGAGAAELRKLLEERLDAAATTVEDAVRAEHQRQAMGHVSIGNTITSLRLCGTLDWNEHIESVSLIEQILRRDPPGIYGRMDFTSRDRYRHAIEELAEATGEAQVRVALRAIESARQVAEQQGLEATAAHVGHHLIARGRRELEIDVAYHPAFKQRLRRALFAQGTFFYLGGIALVTALGAALAVVVARTEGARTWELFWVAALLLVPASEFAVAL
ncbi:MAG: GH36-type glycosyl hydrolase domain-containing protein, partial [Bryobacteraceae bacterium]